VIYGVNLLAAAIAYYLLQLAILHAERDGGVLREALGRDLKGKLSPVLYLAGIAGTLWVGVWLGVVFYAVVAAMWLVPDRRMEAFVAEHGTAT
jgi:uncharacterized membrane protein